MDNRKIVKYAVSTVDSWGDPGTTHLFNDGWQPHGSVSAVIEKVNKKDSILFSQAWVKYEEDLPRKIVAYTVSTVDTWGSPAATDLPEDGWFPFGSAVPFSTVGREPSTTLFAQAWVKYED